MWAKVSATFGAVVAFSLYSPYLSPFRVGAVICALLATTAFQRNTIAERRCRLIGGGLLLLAIAFLRGELLRVLGFIPELVSSSFFLRYGLALAVLLVAVGIAITALKYVRLQSAVATCVVLLCLGNASYFSPEGWGAKTVHLPSVPPTLWIEAQLWARQHTPKDAIFM